MNHVCHTARSEIGKSFTGDLSSDWEVSSQGSDICHVSGLGMRMTFAVERDGSVSSSFEFLDLPETIRDRMDTHVVIKMFANIVYDGAGRNVEEKIAAEVINVRNILLAMRQNGVSTRDMLYFQLGYNTAYTDYASGDFD